MTQMPLAKDDHVIEALTSDRADQSFSIAVLPRRSRRCRSVANAHRANAARKRVAVSTVAITNEVLWRHIGVAFVPVAHVRNHQRISFPERWKRLAVQRLSGNECRKHRSSRRTGTGLSVTGLQHSASFQPSFELQELIADSPKNVRLS